MGQKSKIPPRTRANAKPRGGEGEVGLGFGLGSAGIVGVAVGAALLYANREKIFGSEPPKIVHETQEGKGGNPKPAQNVTTVNDPFPPKVEVVKPLSPVKSPSQSKTAEEEAQEAPEEEAQEPHFLPLDLDPNLSREQKIAEMKNQIHLLDAKVREVRQDKLSANLRNYRTGEEAAFDAKILALEDASVAWEAEKLIAEGGTFDEAQKSIKDLIARNIADQADAKARIKGNEQRDRNLILAGTLERRAVELQKIKNYINKAAQLSF